VDLKSINNGSIPFAGKPYSSPSSNGKISRLGRKDIGSIPIGGKKDLTGYSLIGKVLGLGPNDWKFNSFYPEKGGYSSMVEYMICIHRMLVQFQLPPKNKF
jgi:hypothetical protein